MATRFYPSIVLTVLVFASGHSLAGVDDTDLPPSITHSDIYSGTVKSLINQQRHNILSESESVTPNQPTPLETTDQSSFIPVVPDVVFVGMHEKADGERVAEIFFQGNILQYRRKERLPNQETIIDIEDRVLTTTERQYWLSPIPEASSQNQVDLPLGLIQ